MYVNSHVTLKFSELVLLEPVLSFGQFKKENTCSAVWSLWQCGSLFSSLIGQVSCQSFLHLATAYAGGSQSRSVRATAGAKQG